MKNSIVTPARTYALVVGIEQYAFGRGPGIDLDGPAHDARAFADWLVHQGVPQDNIALLLSPLDHNRHLFEGWSGSWKGGATLKEGQAWNQSAPALSRHLRPRDDDALDENEFDLVSARADQPMRHQL